MGMKTENLPFPLGTTWADGGTAAATDAVNLEGKEYVVESINFADTGIVKPELVGNPKRVRIVRNETGSALLPKRIAKMRVDGSGYEYMTQVDGYATTVGELGYPVDEFLPAAGVADHELFYIVVGGLAKVTSAAAGDTTIPIGNFVIPSTDGKVIDQDITVAAGAATFNQTQGAIGRAVTAVAAINTDFYINVSAK
jgi:hypothetical protein